MEMVVLSMLESVSKFVAQSGLEHFSEFPGYHFPLHCHELTINMLRRTVPPYCQKPEGESYNANVLDIWCRRAGPQN